MRRSVVSDRSSGKIDISFQSALACAGQELQEALAFGLAGFAALENDQTGGRFRAGKFQKILAVASQDGEFRPDGMIPDIRVVRPGTERFRYQ